MGNKQGQELSPEEKQKLKDEKEREKRQLKEEKERKKFEKKEEKRRKKKKKRKEYHGGSAFSERGDDDDDESISSSAWSEKSVGSAPGSWYHSASEPSSKRSSIYLPASAGPGYYQHECWYQGYEDSNSEKSKSPSRTSSTKDTLNLRAASLERYPLGVPTGEPIEPLHKAGSLDFPSAVAHKKDRARRAGSNEETSLIAARYEETIRFSRDHLERTSAERVARSERILTQRASPEGLSLPADRASPTDKSFQTERVTLKERALPRDRVPTRDHAPVTERTPLSDRDSSGDRGLAAGLPPVAGRSVITRASLTSPSHYPAEEEFARGEKRKFPLPAHGLLSREEGAITSEAKRQSLDYTSDHTSVTGSVYYSADEGGSLTGSVYYSATSGSELEDHADDDDILGKGNALCVCVWGEGGRGPR